MAKQAATAEMYEVADKIRERRKALGLTQVQLASAAQLGENTIQRIESGMAQVSTESLFRLARALRTTPNDLAPASYEFSACDFSMNEILTRYQRMNPADKATFINMASVILDGLHARSA